MSSSTIRQCNAAAFEAAARVPSQTTSAILNRLRIALRRGDSASDGLAYVRATSHGNALPSVARMIRWLPLLIGLLIVSSVALATGTPAAADRYRHELRQQAQFVWGLDAPVATFAAQIHQESGWKPNARSPVGALGLAQFMPSTAGWISEIYPALAVNDPYNPSWALRALVTYDYHLWQRVKADDDCEHMAFVLSAYNGGLGWVYKRQKKSTAPGKCFDSTCEINPGIAAGNQRENAAYPRRILLRNEPLYVRDGWGSGSCM